jgi:hypothetical protein
MNIHSYSVTDWTEKSDLIKICTYELGRESNEYFCFWLTELMVRKVILLLVMTEEKI